MVNSTEILFQTKLLSILMASALLTNQYSWQLGNTWDNLKYLFSGERGENPTEKLLPKNLTG